MPRPPGRQAGEIVDQYVALAIPALGGEQRERRQRGEGVSHQVEDEGGGAKARPGGDGHE